MKKFAPILLFMFLMVIGLVCFAQASPSPASLVGVVPDQDVNSLVSQIFAAFAAGKLAVGISAIVVLCTFIFRKYVVDAGKLGSGSLPWVSVVLGIVFGIASNVLFGASPAAAASAILLSGPIASSLWSNVLKLVLHKS